MFNGERERAVHVYARTRAHNTHQRSAAALGSFLGSRVRGAGFDLDHHLRLRGMPPPGPPLKPLGETRRPSPAALGVLLCVEGGREGCDLMQCFFV